MLSFWFASFNIYTVNWSHVEYVHYKTCAAPQEDFVAAHALEWKCSMIFYAYV
jgi:hypothetical protein